MSPPFWDAHQHLELFKVGSQYMQSHQRGFLSAKNFTALLIKPNQQYIK